MVTDDESKNEWITIKIPAKLAEAIDEILPRTTFTNRNRFCEDAIRAQLREFLHDEVVSDDN